MTYGECCAMGALRLKEAGVHEYELDSRLLLEEACHTDWNTLLLTPNRPVSVEEECLFLEWIGKRERRVPLQQILGKSEFCGLEFMVNEHVLLPRQDTEILVEHAMEHLRPGMHILDMCTGSGCVLLSLLNIGKKEKITGLGVDISEEALTVAKANAERILGNLPSGTDEMPLYEFRLGNLFDGIKEEEKFDLIVSNPPYIKTEEIAHLMPEVKDYEPRIALDGQEDGLYFYREIARKARQHLREGAFLLLEVGAGQKKDVEDILLENGYQDIGAGKDYAGYDRVVFGRRE